MGKRDTKWTKDKKERWIKEGRGQGEGANYKPWLRIQDFPSRGRVTRILGSKTGRVHHLFSDLQCKCFYLFDWQEAVIDIREHMPLLDLDEVIDTEDFDLQLFKDKYTKEEYTLTTTFLITTKDKNGKINYFARSVKNKEQLLSKTNVLKMEIERRYWLQKGVHWALITNEEIPELKVKNIEWVHGVMLGSEDYGINENEVVKFCAELMDILFSSDRSVKDTILEFERVNELNTGTGIFLFKYLVISRVVYVNMNEEIDLSKSLRELVIEEVELVC